LRASPELVVDAANQFATYQSSIQALPLNVVLLTTLTFRPEHGVPYMLNVGCTQGREGGKAHLSVFGSGDSGFGSNMALGNCSDFVVWPEGEPKVLLLDNIDGENATYLKCILSYGGGRLKIKNVRFVDCTFQISSAYASNRNVLQFLTEAMTGLPISLDLTP
jgi:hypothetical protein